MTSPDYIFGYAAKLIVANSALGGGLDLAQLKFSFNIRSADNEIPNTATIRVINLSEDTANKIINEYDSISLEAGYESTGTGIIFAGTITQFRKGKESNVETFLEIDAADSDIGYTFGLVNKSLVAGSNPADALQLCAKAMGVTVDEDAIALAQTGGIYPRGKVLFGLARAQVRNIAATLNARWSIQNGKLILIREAGYLPGDVIVLNSATGLIGIPEATTDGIYVRTLLNPRIRVGQRIQINNKDINQQIITKHFIESRQTPPLPAYVPKGDGIYRVLVAEYVGDSRSNDWYTDLTCLAVDSTSPANASVLGS